MARPITYDRNEILEKAMQLFWINGYEQTGIREILESTGFNRHSLYEEFGGKDGLFKEVLEFYKQNIASSVIDPLLEKTSDLHTIKQIFIDRARFEHRRLGCLFSNTANNKQCLEDKLFKVTTDYNRKVEKAFENCLNNAQNKGQIAKDKDPVLLSRFVSTVFHGLGPMSKMGLKNAEITAFGEMTINAIKAK